MSALDAKKPIRTVAVIGTGYVGLPLCLHLAKASLKVTAVDVNPKVVQDINDRTSKIEEERFRTFL